MAGNCQFPARCSVYGEWLLVAECSPIASSHYADIGSQVRRDRAVNSFGIPPPAPLPAFTPASLHICRQEADKKIDKINVRGAQMASVANISSSTSSTAVSSSSGVDRQIAALQKQLKALQKELQSAQKDTSGSNAEKIKLLQQQITQLQQQIAMLQAQKNQSSSQAANTASSQPQAKASSGSLGTQVDEYA